jgi:hypothetical protein
MLDEFKADLQKLDAKQMFRRYLLTGSCFAINDNQYHLLRNEISEYFDVGFTDIHMVGSAKLGFSIKPQKRYAIFGEESDIDLAIVSPHLFEKIWEEVFLYQKTGADWPKSQEFFKYLVEGWVRPDKLPTSSYFELTGQWWKFFQKITSSQKYGQYKIRAGLYYSMFFFEEYQKISIEQCKCI